MSYPHRFLKYLLPVALAVALLGIYLATLAPGLTWANSGADGGDLITAAATGGVAHPTGYPTWLVIARMFQFLPVGSLAFRTNLFSAVATALAALFVYLLTTRFLAELSGQRRWLGGLAAGLSFGLAPLVWSQAVITEVYALNALFVAGLLYLSTARLGASPSSRWQDALLGLLFGLALGNHITIATLFPVVLITLLPTANMTVGGKWSIRNARFDLRSACRRLLWIVLGLSIYLTLPLRALSHPPVNWENPVTPIRLAWLVSGRLYHYESFITSAPQLLERIQTLASLLLDQFGLIGLTLALVGLIVFFRPDRLYFSLLWIALTSLVFAVLYSTNDSYVYLIPSLLCFSIWLGVAVERSLDRLARRWKVVSLAAGVAVLLLLLVQAGIHWRAVDASQDTRAENFANFVLKSAPSDAIVFARGDQAIFALWYYRYALHSRPDLAVIASDLLQYDWYLETLRSTYPTMDLSEPFPFPETVVELNPSRSVCYVQYDRLPVVNCLPPGGLARP